jgi:hypothetical protein
MLNWFVCFFDGKSEKLYKKNGKINQKK